LQDPYIFQRLRASSSGCTSLTDEMLFYRGQCFCAKGT